MTVYGLGPCRAHYLSNGIPKDDDEGVPDLHKVFADYEEARKKGRNTGDHGEYCDLKKLNEADVSVKYWKRSVAEYPFLMPRSTNTREWSESTD